MQHFKLGTRASQLAIWQAEAFEQALHRQFKPKVSTKLVKITTTGDKNLQSPLYKIGGKGLFIKELEKALITEKIDIAVHSLKDVPGELDPAFSLRPVLRRELALDIVVSKNFKRLKSIPSRAKIATSSLRRGLQLKKINPHFDICNIRGNINSRLEKLETGKYDALLLAAAGFIRLGIKHNYLILQADTMLPAIGQGILAVQYLKKRTDISKLVTKTVHKNTLLCATCERKFLSQLRADCFSPVAGYSYINKNKIFFKAAIFSGVSSRQLDFSSFGPADDAELVGERVANRFLEAGAAKILAENKEYYSNN